MIVEEDVRHHVEHIAKTYDLSASRVVGFRDTREVHVDGPVHVENRGLRCTVVQVQSELAMRRAMRDHAQQHTDEREVLVVITPLGRRDLGKDVLSRMTHRRLFGFDPWEAAGTVFGAHRVDPMLRPRRSLGDALLKHAARVNKATETSGVITEDSAWSSLLRDAFGLPEDFDRMSAWLTWSVAHEPDARGLFVDEQALHADLCAYMRGRTGEVFDVVFGLLGDRLGQGRSTREVVALGLALRAAYEAEEEAGHDVERIKAITKFVAHCEQALGLKGKEGHAHAQAIAEAASSAYLDLTRHDDAAARVVVDGLDRLFAEHDASDIAAFSRAARQGWAARLGRLEHAFVSGDPDEINQALDALREHDDARRNPSLVRLIGDAARLAYKYREPAWELPGSGDLAAMARDYIDSSSFEDRIRETLASHDGGDEKATALIEQVMILGRRIRVESNRDFARTLSKSLSKHTSGPSGVIPIHQVLERVVAPLASSGRVLMLVLDGMSWAVARALLEDDVFDAWNTWVPADDEGVHTPMFAAVPSLTRLSRASLLCGAVRSGGQDVEKKGFEGNHRLRSALPKGHRAELFHMGELSGSGAGAIGEKVRDAMRDSRVRVVGVVLNAIDDQLSGALQVSIDWHVDAITPLRSLLELAREEKRAVVFTSDHGHVIDYRTSRVEAPDALSARHRALTEGDVHEGEVVVGGAGVRAHLGEEQCVVLHDESERYKSQKRGYHGGISLPEVVTPLLVLTHEGSTPPADEMASLVEFQTATPGWWRLRQPESSTAVPRSIQSKHSSHTEEEPPPEPPTAQLDILGGTSAGAQASEAEDAADVPDEAPADVAWVERLLDTDLYRSMEARSHVRVLPEEIYKVFVTLEHQRGVASVEQLARELQRAPNRIRNLVKGVQLLVNIDGYEVLSFNRAEGKLTLDRALLFTQFGLE
jgi:hypothetical protein